jgi:ADP-heptose:LPS heptosyltransferase
MLSWIVAGAKYFIGPDSGVAQIAVACNVPSVIFFGSVNPEYRYVLNDRIKVIQNTCPSQKDGCYHEVLSTVGQDCVVDVQQPPCITHKTFDIIDQIKDFIK